MKKLLAISLLMFSSMTFAETVTPDLLVGKWQCKSESSFDNENMQYSQIAQQTFYKNGTYESKDTIYGKKLAETIKSRSNGKWYIKDNILNMNIDEILSLSTDKPSYTDVNVLNETLINNHEFSQFIIKKFSLNKFVSTLTKKDQIELQGNTIDTCERIH